MVNRLIKNGWIAMVVVGLMLASAPAEAKGWDYDLAVYLWALGMDGKATVRGMESTIDVSFSDLFDNLDMAFATHFEAGKRESNWGWFFDLYWAQLSQDLEQPRGTIDFEMAYVEGAGAYSVSEDFQLLAGFRYITMDADVSTTPEPPIPPNPPGMQAEGDQSFTDLMLGGRLHKEFGKRWGFIGRADLAGFGVTDGTDLTWNLQLLGTARIAKRIRLLLGYRWFDIDYENTDDNFALDVRQEGPVFALNYSFY